MIFISFLWFSFTGGDIPLFGRMISTGAVQDWRMFSIVAFMTWIIIILSFLSFIGSLLTGILLSKTKTLAIQPKEKVVEKAHVPSDLLMPDEKTIVEALEDNGGSLTQSELRLETGMSKVKLHRYLKKLEAKNIVSKHAYGMTNKIKLEKKLKN